MIRTLLDAFARALVSVLALVLVASPAHALNSVRVVPATTDLLASRPLGECAYVTADGALYCVTDTAGTWSMVKADVVAGSIATADLAADSVTAAKIAADAVGTSEIATDGVGAAEIAAGAVGTSEIADGTVAYADHAGDLSYTCNLAGGATTSCTITVPAAAICVCSVVETDPSRADCVVSLSGTTLTVYGTVVATANVLCAP